MSQAPRCLGFWRARCAPALRDPSAAVRRGRSGRAAGEPMDGLAFSRGQEARSKSPAPTHELSVHGWTESANRGGLLFGLLFSWPRKRKVTRAPAGARNRFETCAEIHRAIPPIPECKSFDSASLRSGRTERVRRMGRTKQTTNSQHPRVEPTTAPAPHSQCPNTVTVTLRWCGSRRCSHRNNPCQVPSCGLPPCTGTTRLTPVSTARTWAGMSSGPSASCWKIASPSGTARASQRSRSSRTVGSAFSLSSSEQLVCAVNTWAMPSCTPLAATTSATLSVISVKPRPRVCAVKPCCPACSAGTERLMARLSSWIQQSVRPGLAVPAPAHALVQAELGAVPELDRVRLDQVAAPVRRARHVAAFELALVARHALVEALAAGQVLRLQRGPGADLAAARPRAQVRVGFLRLQLARHALHPHLHATAQLLPVEAQRHLRVRRQLAALVAVVVGVEAQAALVHALQQHDARGHAAVGVHRGQVHRGGLGVAGGLRLLQQLPESIENFGAQHDGETFPLNRGARAPSCRG